MLCLSPGGVVQMIKAYNYIIIYTLCNKTLDIYSYIYIYQRRMNSSQKQQKKALIPLIKDLRPLDLKSSGRYAELIDNKGNTMTLKAGVSPLMTAKEAMKNK